MPSSHSPSSRRSSRGLIASVNAAAARLPWWLQAVLIFALLAVLGRCARAVDSSLAPYLPAIF